MGCNNYLEEQEESVLSFSDLMNGYGVLLKILISIFMILLGGLGFVLIQSGQYRYKEKFIQRGFKEGFYNSSIRSYPENKKARKLLIAGQICIIIDIVIALIFYFNS
jgi:hypothetical protein